MVLSWQNNRRLSEFSTFGIGGPIRYFAEIRTSEQMKEAFLFCRDRHIPFFILGKGSNCLFSDSEFQGAVLLNRIDFCRWDGDLVSAGAGYPFSLLGIQSAKRGLSGLEFASGIPASVGGAVFMNAGAHGAETCDRLDSVIYLDIDGNEREFFRKELDFSYRSSPFQKMSGAVLSASFVLTSNLEARRVQLDILQKRIDTQPLKEKSAGCVFRNPDLMSAGALIDRCGLKGLRVGDAEVSAMHANFIVNRGSATASDVIALIRTIQIQVHEKTGVRLEPEIRMIGRDESISS
jgi:UDP-N-acetylmuramate dehydrogenase